jgi:hypothetical protein
MTVKDATSIGDLANRNIPSIELQDVAFEAKNEKKMIPRKVVQVKAVGLNDEEMSLIIRRFKQALKGHENNNNKPWGSVPTSNVVILVILLLTIQIMIMLTRKKQERGRWKRKRGFTKGRKLKPTSTRSGTQTAAPPTLIIKASQKSPLTSHLSSLRSTTLA